MAQYVFNKFKKTLPVIVGMAMDSNTEESFFDSLRKLATDSIKNNISDTSVKNAQLVLEMLEHEAKYIP